MGNHFNWNGKIFQIKIFEISPKNFELFNELFFNIIRLIIDITIRLMC